MFPALPAQKQKNALSFMPETPQGVETQGGGIQPMQP